MVEKQDDSAKKLNTELGAAVYLSLLAGRKIMNIYQTENFSVEYKEDETPITLADKQANEVIVANLQNSFSDYALLSEESRDDPDRLKNDWCWIIDPLDGTKEFVKRNGEFAVNIALTYRQESVLGVIYQPVTGDLYYAVRGQGAYYHSGLSCEDISDNPFLAAAEDERGSELTADAGDDSVKADEKKLPHSLTEFLDNIFENSSRIEVSRRKENLRVVKSRSHGSGRLNRLLEKNEDRIAEVRELGSSLKGCLIARGKAEVYYRFTLTKEWDLAAMDSIVTEAGGIMRNLKSGERFRYNRENTLNEAGFYVVNREESRLELE